MKKVLFTLFLTILTIPASVTAQETFVAHSSPSTPVKSQKLSIGGYGDIHLNGGPGDQAEYFDIHRFVVYIGYQFNKWVRLNSETEIEHAFVSKESGGELSIEQLNITITIDSLLRFRLGRFLAPLGLINKHHEPTKFNGVERPLFAKYIVPSTWSMDGAEVYGGKKGRFTYELGVVASLDGTAFSDMNGIRDGRVKERAGFDSPSFTGRVQVAPFPALSETTKFLHLGASFFHGKVNSGNKGKLNGMDSWFTMVSADMVFRWSWLELRSVFAYTNLTDSENSNPEVAKNMLGFYLEGSVDLPSSITTPVNAKKITLFARYEQFDTQHTMFDNASPNLAGNREAVTGGIGWFIAKDAVLKLDYTWLKSESETKGAHLINAGIGFIF